MKKYKMLTITMIMIILTTAVYLYDSHNNNIPEIPNPSFNINSSKFGEIKEIKWVSNYINGENILLILSTKTLHGVTTSYLNSLNVDTGETVLLSQYPAHKYLDNVITVDMAYSQIITAYSNGIVRTTLLKDSTTNLFYKADSQKFEIEDFENADSMDFNGNIHYTLTEDELIHTKNFDIPFSLYGHNQQPENTRVFTKPYYIVNANRLEDALTYTATRNNKVNLYSIAFDGTPKKDFNLPIFSNVVTAKGIDDGIGFVGMKVSKDKEFLNVFMIRKLLYLETAQHIFDSIPNHTDRYGAAPSIDSATFNHEYTLVYTSYNENHNGMLKINDFREGVKIILEEEGLFGPVRITEKRIGEDQVKLILYLTEDEEGIRVKICDLEGNLYKDITELII